MVQVRNKKICYFVGLNAALGSVLYGYQMSNISSIRRLYANVNNLTFDQADFYISIIIAAAPLGAIIGSLLILKLLQKFGHRYLLVILDVCAIFSLLVQCLKLSFFPLFIGRIMVGIVIGINSGIIPRYIFGVTPKQLSGSLAFLTQLMFTVGLTFGYGLGFFINPSQIFNQNRWRYFLLFPSITCLIRAISLLTFMPYHLPVECTKIEDIRNLENLYYKIYQSHHTHQSLGQSRKRIQNEAPQKTLQQTRLQIQHSKQAILQHRPPKYDSYYYFFVCIILTMSNQLCGINAILIYAKQLFLKITTDDYELTQMIILFLGILQVVSSFIGGKIMDNKSKKTFLIVGESVMAICLYLIYKLQKNQAMVVLLIFIHTISYRFSVGPLYNLYAAKMLRRTASITLTNWSTYSVVALVSQYMMDSLGVGKMCMIYCVMLTICILFLVNSVPNQLELMGSSQIKLNEIDDTPISTTDQNHLTQLSKDSQILIKKQIVQ